MSWNMYLVRDGVCVLMFVILFSAIEKTSASFGRMSCETVKTCLHPDAEHAEMNARALGWKGLQPVLEALILNLKTAAGCNRASEGSNIQPLDPLAAASACERLASGAGPQVNC